ncbi:ribose 5-phosphate isomerase A [Chryseobacterium taichungense]|uniref:Ribose-5-phosphate isomerase A n=1 Tax=Chryseobacterium taichungense TaxID=295069 RepID=A0A1H8C299_9FLAO|nr:ribose-5-phosphate isomerase RpiA [Chryseobacterium taichungense]SEM89210.1 ribose 5-phosphate isomerase A [Chryseobacterium taichungense]
MKKDLEKEKQLAAKEAVKYLSDNKIIGLGTGSTIYYAIKEIAELVKNGLQIQAVPTSDKTEELAISLEIPIIDINTIDTIDITIDGADEFTKDLTLIKGGGGALLREKIVASMTKEEIIIADSSKYVEKLGKFKLPIEVIPFASKYVHSKIRDLQGEGNIRFIQNRPFLTDEGNYIIDVDFGFITNPPELSHALTGIEGVVGHGLFIDLAQKVIMVNNDDIIVFEK